MHDTMHAHAYAIRIEQGMADAETTRALAQLPEREIRLSYVTRVKEWIAEHRRDRRFAVARKNFVSRQRSTSDV